MAIAHVQKLATGGIVSIKYADKAEIAVGTVWTEAFYTLRDSVSVTQSEPTKAEILVDQLDAPIYLNYTDGDFKVTGTIPNTAASVLGLIYNTTTAPYAPTGYTATGVNTNIKVLNKMWQITFESGQVIIITNGDFAAALDGSTLKTTALAHKFTIVAKAGTTGIAQGAEVVMWNLV